VGTPFQSPAEADTAAQEPTGFREAVEQFSDVRWRLSNLYWIVDKAAKRIPFRPNWGQLVLMDNLHYLNVLLKARQIGFSTFIQLLMLDACVFSPNIAAGTVADTRENAEDIFKSKAKYPYENLPEAIKAANPALEDSARQLTFRNNSFLRVGTSLRSGTYQYLHVSEYGKTCSKNPEKAKEIRTGALNTVQAGQFVFVESTAEGQEGDFHDMCAKAQEKQRRGVPLTPLDFRFHFFPWHREPGYVLDPAHVEIDVEMEKYFADLKEAHGIELTAAQKAWYVKKYETQQDDMLREYPSTPEEAFKGSIEGAIFGKQIAKAEREGRVRRVSHDPALKVNTWWDLGKADAMAIIFWQQSGPEKHFIDYAEHNLEDIPYYVRLLQKKRDERGYIYGRHSWPHDGGHVRLGMGGKSLQTQAWDLGLSVEVQPPYEIAATIQRARQLLGVSWFDTEHCDGLLKALRSYRYEWNSERECWRSEPLHNWASHGASAFRCGAMDEGDYSNAFVDSVQSNAVHKRRERYAPRPQRRGSIWAA